MDLLTYFLEPTLKKAIQLCDEKSVVIDEVNDQCIIGKVQGIPYTLYFDQLLNYNYLNNSNESLFAAALWIQNELQSTANTIDEFVEALEEESAKTLLKTIFNEHPDLFNTYATLLMQGEGYDATLTSLMDQINQFFDEQDYQNCLGNTIALMDHIISNKYSDSTIDNYLNKCVDLLCDLYDETDEFDDTISSFIEQRRDDFIDYVDLKTITDVFDSNEEVDPVFEEKLLAINTKLIIEKDISTAFILTKDFAKEVIESNNEYYISYVADLLDEIQEDEAFEQKVLEFKQQYPTYFD